MLLTDSGDSLSWWQVWDVDDQFELWVTINNITVGWQHPKKSLTSSKVSLSMMVHDKVTNITLSRTSLLFFSNLTFCVQFCHFVKCHCKQFFCTGFFFNEKLISTIRIDFSCFCFWIYILVNSMSLRIAFKMYQTWVSEYISKSINKDYCYLLSRF